MAAGALQPGYADNMLLAALDDCFHGLWPRHVDDQRGVSAFLTTCNLDTSTIMAALLHGREDKHHVRL